MQIRGLFKVDMWSRWLWLWLCASFVYKTVHRVDVIGTRLDHSLHFASILHSASVGIFRRQSHRDPDKRCPGSSIHPFIIHRMRMVSLIAIQPKCSIFIHRFTAWAKRRKWRNCRSHLGCRLFLFSFWKKRIADSECFNRGSTTNQ